MTKTERPKNSYPNKNIFLNEFINAKWTEYNNNS